MKRNSGGEPKSQRVTRARLAAEKARKVAEMQQAVFEVVLSNKLLHWSEAMNLAKVSKGCERAWKANKDHLLEPLLEELCAIAKCKKIVDFVTTLIHNLHSHFDLKHLSRPSYSP